VLQREHAAHGRIFRIRGRDPEKGKRMIGKLAGVAGSLCCCAMLAGCGGTTPSAASSAGGTLSPASSGGTASPPWASASGMSATSIFPDINAWLPWVIKTDAMTVWRLPPHGGDRTLPRVPSRRGADHAGD